MPTIFLPAADSPDDISRLFGLWCANYDCTPMLWFVIGFFIDGIVPSVSFFVGGSAPVTILSDIFDIFVK